MAEVVAGVGEVGGDEVGADELASGLDELAACEGFGKLSLDSGCSADSSDAAEQPASRTTHERASTTCLVRKFTRRAYVALPEPFLPCHSAEVASSRLIAEHAGHALIAIQYPSNITSHSVGK